MYRHKMRRELESDLLRGQADILYDEERYRKAIIKYSRAIKMNPDSSITYNNWGSALNCLGRFDEAIRKLMKAIDLYPYYTLAYENWAEALISKGSYEEAIDKLRERAKID